MKIAKAGADLGTTCNSIRESIDSTRTIGRKTDEIIEGASKDFRRAGKNLRSIHNGLLAIAGTVLFGFGVNVGAYITANAVRDARQEQNELNNKTEPKAEVQVEVKNK